MISTKKRDWTFEAYVPSEAYVAINLVGLISLWIPYSTYFACDA